MKHLHSRYPTKTTMNLVIHEKTMNSPSRALPLFFAALLLIGVGCKFLVLDQLDRVNQARAVLLNSQRELAAAEATLADYEAVAEEYSRYSYQAFTADELALADRIAVLDLLEHKIMPRAELQNAAVRDQVLSLTLSGVTLEQTSQLVAELEQDPIVADVVVYTAGSDKESQREGDKPLSVTMTLTLTAEKGGES